MKKREQYAPGPEVAACPLPRWIEGHVIKYLSLALDELQAESLRHMPGDMAVHEPGSRVVELQERHMRLCASDWLNQELRTLKAMNK